MKTAFISLLICSICLLAPVFCDDTTVSTTTDTTTTTTSTTTKSTTTTELPTTTTTTSKTTTASSTTTTLAPTTSTTTAAPVDTILSFRLPKNESVPACLRANMSLEFKIKYITEVEKVKSNATADFILNELDDFDGQCGEELEKLKLSFKGSWSLELDYLLVNKAYYELNAIVFKYEVTAADFPNAAPSELGVKTVAASNLTEFSANKDNSYKCFAKSVLSLNDNINVEITNYQAQPFLSEKQNGFDTAIECAADTTGTSKLVPIIVGSALALLVVMVLVAYIIGRRKHRPGYQQV